MQVVEKDLIREDWLPKENRNEDTELKFCCVDGGDDGGTLWVLVKSTDRGLLSRERNPEMCQCLRSVQGQDLVAVLHWALIILSFVQWSRSAERASRFQGRGSVWMFRRHCQRQVALWQCGPSEAESQLCGVVSDAVGMLMRVRPKKRFLHCEVSSES